MKVIERHRDVSEGMFVSYILSIICYMLYFILFICNIGWACGPGYIAGRFDQIQTWDGLLKSTCLYTYMFRSHGGAPAGFWDGPRVLKHTKSC